MAAIIDKLPLIWKHFKSYLKHKRKEMSFEDLITKLQVEKGNKNNDKKSVIHNKNKKAKTNKLGLKVGASKK